MTKTTKTIQTATNKELSAGFAEITETTKMTKTTGIQGANQRFPKPQVSEYPSKQSIKQENARGMSEVRRGTSSIHFHCPVPRSSSLTHIGAYASWFLSPILKFRSVTIRGAQPSARLSEEICLREGFLEASAGVSSRVLQGSAGCGRGPRDFPRVVTLCV